MKQILYFSIFIMLTTTLYSCSADMSDEYFNDYYTDIATAKQSSEGLVYFELDNHKRLLTKEPINWDGKQFNQRYYLEFSILSENSSKNTITINLIGYNYVKVLPSENPDERDSSWHGTNNNFKIWGNGNFINLTSYYSTPNEKNEAKITLVNVDKEKNTIKLRFIHPSGGIGSKYIHAFSTNISEYIEMIDSEYIIFEIDYWNKNLENYEWNTETYLYEKGKEYSIHR